MVFDSVPREAETFSKLIYRDKLEEIHFLGDEFLPKYEAFMDSNKKGYLGVDVARRNNQEVHTKSPTLS